jgi:hypothetical protein
MWKLDTRTLLWTCLGKPKDGVYGTKGTPSPLNWPATTHAAAVWVIDQTTYMFGGLNDFATGANDIWTWNGSMWTWISGAGGIPTLGKYAAYRQWSSENEMSIRSYLTPWKRGDELWLFGGLQLSNATFSRKTANYRL